MPGCTPGRARRLPTDLAARGEEGVAVDAGDVVSHVIEARVLAIVNEGGVCRIGAVAAAPLKVVQRAVPCAVVQFLCLDAEL